MNRTLKKTRVAAMAALLVAGAGAHATAITGSAEGAGLVLNTTLLPTLPNGLVQISTTLPGTATIGVASNKVVLGPSVSASVITGTSVASLLRAQTPLSDGIYKETRTQNGVGSTIHAAVPGTRASLTDDSNMPTKVARGEVLYANLQTGSQATSSLSLDSNAINTLVSHGLPGVLSLVASTSLSAGSSSNVSTSVLSGFATLNSSGYAQGAGAVQGATFSASLGTLGLTSTCILMTCGNDPFTANLFSLALGPYSGSTGLLATTTTLGLSGTAVHSLDAFAFGKLSLSGALLSNLNITRLNLGVGNSLNVADIDLGVLANLFVDVDGKPRKNTVFGGSQTHGYHDEVAHKLDSLLSILGLELTLNEQNQTCQAVDTGKTCAETNALHLRTYGSGLLSSFGMLPLMNLDLKLGHSYAALQAAAPPPPNPVSEPSALALAALGLTGLFGSRRLRRRQD